MQALLNETGDSRDVDLLASSLHGSMHRLKALASGRFKAILGSRERCERESAGCLGRCAHGMPSSESVLVAAALPWSFCQCGESLCMGRLDACRALSAGAGRCFLQASCSSCLSAKRTPMLVSRVSRLVDTVSMKMSLLSVPGLCGAPVCVCVCVVRPIGGALCARSSTPLVRSSQAHGL